MCSKPRATAPRCAVPFASRRLARSSACCNHPIQRWVTPCVGRKGCPTRLPQLSLKSVFEPRRSLMIVVDPASHTGPRCGAFHCSGRPHATGSRSHRRQRRAFSVREYADDALDRPFSLFGSFFFQRPLSSSARCASTSAAAASFSKRSSGMPVFFMAVYRC